MKTAPVQFIGTQSGFGVRPDFTLWNVTLEGWEGYSVGATISDETITRLGYAVPESPDQIAHLWPDPPTHSIQRTRQALKDSFNPFHA
jgi:hypothetical protein